MEIKNVKMIDVDEFDKLVTSTYLRPYSFQQQDGCKERGIFRITIPNEYTQDDEMNDKIPEIINGEVMGVKFDVWLKRNPKSPLNPSKEELKDCYYYFGESEEEEIEWKQDEAHIALFFKRNFYPDIQMVANDLHKKGLIESGDYIINIDW